MRAQRSSKATFHLDTSQRPRPGRSARDRLFCGGWQRGGQGTPRAPQGERGGGEPLRGGCQRGNPGRRSPAVGSGGCMRSGVATDGWGDDDRSVGRGDTREPAPRGDAGPDPPHHPVPGAASMAALPVSRQPLPRRAERSGSCREEEAACACADSRGVSVRRWRGGGLAPAGGRYPV